MRKKTLVILLPLLAIATIPHAAIEIKAVVISMYEIGEDTGDLPGEFQFWIERNEVEKIEAPLGWRDYYKTPNNVLIICTGGGITNTTASVMALAVDKRFDLTQSYWIVAGIAGGDPQDCSLGSAAWAKWIVDGDLAKEIDAREMPKGWPYGMIALGAKKPNTLDNGWQVETIKFQLNESLVDWAYELTRDFPLPENEEVKEFSKIYKDYPNATRPPFVMIGASLAASTYWHGNALNDWANDWVRLHTDGAANFVMSNMEDSGTATALKRADAAGLVDFDRFLVLRTASNFSTPPPNEDVAWSLNATYPANGKPALEAAYHLTKVVVDELVTNWDTYSTTLPGSE